MEKVSSYGVETRKEFVGLFNTDKLKINDADQIKEFIEQQPQQKSPEKNPFFADSPTIVDDTINNLAPNKTMDSSIAGKNQQQQQQQQQSLFKDDTTIQQSPVQKPTRKEPTKKEPMIKKVEQQTVERRAEILKKLAEEKPKSRQASLRSPEQSYIAKNLFQDSTIDIFGKDKQENPKQQSPDQSNQNQNQKSPSPEPSFDKKIQQQKQDFEALQKQLIIEQDIKLQQENQKLFLQKREEKNINLMDRVRKKYSGNVIFIMNRYLVENNGFIYQEFMEQQDAEKKQIMLDIVNKIESKYGEIKEMKEKIVSFNTRFNCDNSNVEAMEQGLYFILKEFYLIDKSEFVIDVIKVVTTVLQFLDDQFGNVVGIEFTEFSEFFCEQLKGKRQMLSSLLDKYSKYFTKDNTTNQQKAHQIELGNFGCLEQQEVNYDFLFLKVFVFAILSFNAGKKMKQYAEDNVQHKNAFYSNNTTINVPVQATIKGIKANSMNTSTLSTN